MLKSPTMIYQLKKTLSLLLMFYPFNSNTSDISSILSILYNFIIFFFKVHEFIFNI